jgi:hypothetical protein
MNPQEYQLFFDGWYINKPLAASMLEETSKKWKCIPIGLVESEHGTWGLMYWRSKPIFDNHSIDGDNAICAPLRKRDLTGRIRI